GAGPAAEGLAAGLAPAGRGAALGADTSPCLVAARRHDEALEPQLAARQDLSDRAPLGGEQRGGALPVRAQRELDRLPAQPHLELDLAERRRVETHARGAAAALGEPLDAVGE